MTREATLLAKHEDLKRCLESRKSLLLELYRSTAVLAKIRNRSAYLPTQHDNDQTSEQSFLNANDLSIGHFFHPSTLPSFDPEHPHDHASSTHKFHHAPAVVGIAGPRASSPTSGTKQSSSEARLSTTTSEVLPSSAPNQPDTTVACGPDKTSLNLAEHGTSNSGTDSGGRALVERSGVASTPETAIIPKTNDLQTVQPLDDLPLSADDAGKLPESVLKQLVAEKKQDGARTVHLPPKAKQEQRLKGLDSHSLSDAHQHNDQSIPQLHKVSRLESDHAHVPSHSPDRLSDSDALVSQTESARSDAAIGRFPFPSNEQFQSEEARSLQMRSNGSHPTPDSADASHSYTEVSRSENDSGALSLVPSVEFRSMDTLRREQQQLDAASEKSALRNYTFPSDVAKNITLSQRPPMRIDTGVSQSVDSTIASRLKNPLENGAATSHTPPDSAIPVKPIPNSAPTQSPPERMTTRVSSGALRHKPVSEILGETRKPASPQTDRPAHIDPHRDPLCIQSPRPSVSTTSPDPAAFRLRLNELKGKEKSKLSTVVFARKQPSQSERLQFQELVVSEEKSENKEYFLRLFSAQSCTPPQSQRLNTLIGSASKTLTTANHYMDFHEQQDCRILTKIQHLQNCNRWSLRQLERSVEPDRPMVHWDVLLSSTKWLRTDFREERKWKLAAASSMASWCAHWVAGSKQERAALQVKIRPASSIPAAVPYSAPTPDLIPSAEDDSSESPEDEVYNVDLSQGNAPAAIFSMAPEMFYFGLEKSPVTEKLLQELPLYQPSVEVQKAVLRQSHLKSDREWRVPLLPVSKFSEGQLSSHDEGPPRKRSRYNYAALDQNSSLESLEVSDIEDGTRDVRPTQDDVALFNPENKHIRDRIHAGHAFRPPSEHPMPSQSFFESRQSSQWTQVEDDRLRRLVREYAYNWSLISSCLSVPSAFSAGAERRTPWECFERWIGLEGLPAEMAKTQYFRAYHGRLQAAQTTHEAQQQAIQQQQGSNAPHMPLRRRSTQPFLVERRKNTRHVHLVNAIRNLARKREATTKKQEEVAELAAIRKATQTVPPKHPMQTPQEMSRIKYDRELRAQEQAKAYRLQVMQQQQKAHAAQRTGMQIAQHPNSTNPAQPTRTNAQAPANGNGLPNLPVSGPMQTNLSGQPRASAIPRPSNGVQSNGAFPMNQQGIPHAPMQPANMPGPARLPPPMGSDSMRIYQEANRVQAEQQRFLQQQRQQQHPQINGPISPNANNANLIPSNGSSAQTTFPGRSASPSMNGAPPAIGSSSSPRMTNPSQPQALSSGSVPTINQVISQIRARNPNATQEQISQLATNQLKQITSHSHAHAAMQAAAGAGGSISANVMNGATMNSNGIGNLAAPSQQQPATAIMNGNPLVSTQQYAHMIRNQQQHQQNRSSGTPFSGQRPSSRSATPQIHRTPSTQGGHPSPSPVPSQAQLVGGQ
ncbi:MAG: hypothetical protein Q9224_000809 [Gallowayella concinna]